MRSSLVIIRRMRKVSYRALQANLKINPPAAHAQYAQKATAQRCKKTEAESK